MRFCDVKEPRLFAVTLDNIIIGAKKIYVNLPRFEREKNGEKRRNQNSGGHKGMVMTPTQHLMWKVIHDGLGGDSGGNKEKGKKDDRRDDEGSCREPKVVYFRKKNLYDLCYEVSEKDMKLFSKMYVGVVRNPRSAHMVQEWFNMQGFFSIKVTLLGANLVLMEEIEEGIISALISDAHEWLYEKFEDIRGWGPMELDNERVVWVRCHGIPVHAWNNEFFSSLARKFGVFLGVDENT